MSEVPVRVLNQETARVLARVKAGEATRVGASASPLSDGAEGGDTAGSADAAAEEAMAAVISPSAHAADLTTAAAPPVTAAPFPDRNLGFQSRPPPRS